MAKKSSAGTAATWASTTCDELTPAIHIIVVVSPTTLPEPPAFEAAAIAARKPVCSRPFL